MKVSTIPVILGFTILAAATAVAIYISNTEQSIKLTGQAEVEKTGIFYVWPTETKTTPNKEISLNIALTTEDKEVKEALAKFSWNPKVVELKSIQNGTTFNIYKDKEIDNEKGTATVRAMGNFSGTGTFASLVFRGKKTGSTNIRIHTNDSKLTENSGANILQGVNNGTLVVQ